MLPAGYPLVTRGYPSQNSYYDIQSKCYRPKPMTPPPGGGGNTTPRPSFYFWINFVWRSKGATGFGTFREDINHVSLPNFMTSDRLA